MVKTIGSSSFVAVSNFIIDEYRNKKYVCVWMFMSMYVYIKNILIC